VKTYEWSIIGTGDPIESENKLEFRLLYQGELLPCGNSNKRVPEKHAIRKSLHPQLKRLWNMQKGLRQYASYVGAEAVGKKNEYMHSGTRDKWVGEGLEALGKNWNRSGFNFVPLVTSDFALRCRLDILLLRPTDEKFVLRQGDLDGHVKTIFDALRIPSDAQELGEAKPAEDENPFFCLLQDDNLISEVHVVGDQLLVLPNGREVRANDAFAVIHVQINHLGGRPFSRWFD